MNLSDKKLKRFLANILIFVVAVWYLLFTESKNIRSPICGVKNLNF